MALPAAIAYAPPVPPQRDLPASRAPWTLDPARTAVLVHDLQDYFLRPYDAASPLLTGLLEGTTAILAAARAAGVPVFYTAQDGDHSDRALQGDLWGPGMSAAPADTAIHEAVAPVAGDTVLVKKRYSAFAKSDLADRLRAGGRDQLVVVGVYAGIGITATAYDAFCRDVQPFVVADATADLGPEQHARALDLVASCTGVVTSTANVLAALSPAPADESGGAADAEAGWAALVRRALLGVTSAGLVEAAVAAPAADLFELGLNSLQAFDLLDELAEAGVDIDYGVFTRQATLTYLVEQGAVLV
jgi:bifunctional isochorismate lyase/aryl carrier protein